MVKPRSLITQLPGVARKQSSTAALFPQNCLKEWRDFQNTRAPLINTDECHPSCWQCTGPSADNCTSCPSPSSLHEGQCVPSCPRGFFVQDNQCQACHPSCQTCSGPSQADCTSCPPLASLQSGYCRTSCQDGLFLNAATGECLR
ncbi:extracellular matrix protein FRAS1-like protein [Lates japonicus]|uniref:Extracellular matrix protein FRAS1-like protein n=1 Tax=Lates japonicus TaxID=270547 RepID=A0AAD3RMV8_LATJO|nr:extracellular matrix protein FRAS1-like protein [Lates japonicus]